MMLRRTLVCALTLALIAPLACKKKADVTAGEAAAALKGAPNEHPAVEKGLDTWPAGVLALIGVQSLDAVEAMAKAAGSGLGPLAGADILSGPLALPEGVKAVVDTGKPLYAIVSLEGGEPKTTLSAPLKDAARVEAALKARDAGDGSQLEAMGFGGGHVVVVGDRLVRSDDAATFAAHRPLLEKAHASFQPATPLQMLVSGEVAFAAAKPLLEEARREFLEEMRFGAMGSPLPMSPDDLMAYYGAYFDAVVALAGELRQMDLRFQVDAERLRFEVLVDVKADGLLHKLVAHGEKGGIASAGLLPPGAYGVLAANLDPSTFQGMQDTGAKMLSAMMKDGGVASSDIVGSFKDLYEVQTGDTAMAMYTSEGFPFAMAGVVLTKDGSRYREGLKKLSDLYLRWVESMVGKAGGGAPPLDFSSWERMFDGMSAMTGAFGVKMDLRTDGDVVGLGVGVNWDSIGAFGDPDSASRNAKLFGSRWEMAFGFGPVVSAVCFGPKAFDDAEKVLAGGFEYTDDAFQASVKRGAAHPFLMVWFDLGRASNALADIVEGVMMAFDGPTAKAAAQKLRGMKPGSGLAFSLGGSGTTLQAVLDLPLAPIREVSELF